MRAPGRGLIPAHAGKTVATARLRRSSRAHPRSRGENDPPTASIADRMGSSPLTRGKHVDVLPGTYRLGLIPAHAGKTHAPGVRAAAYRAHPRSRGENSAHQQDTARETGSSPLTRGKRNDRARKGARGGLIPAHAGKTPCSGRRPGMLRAHPRSRGENSWTLVSTRAITGSSPLTRGKPAQHLVAQLLEGLIPAHAGKTAPAVTSWSPATAHPRSRGENMCSSQATWRRVGSSPLTRGKPVRAGISPNKLGLIPAHAGKTPSAAAQRGTARAHPRSRGENRLVMRELWESEGSSPLTRGKHEEPQARGPRQGLIPAHAGKTLRRSRISVEAGAHPRSRGENVQGRSTALMGVGSSPLTRGKRPGQ